GQLLEPALNLTVHCCGLEFRVLNGYDQKSFYKEQGLNCVVQTSTQQCMKSRVAKHLGVAGLKQQNGLVDETNVTLFAKIGFKTPVDMLGFLVGLLLLSKGCLNRLRNIGFNESEEYKKTFICFGIGTGSMQVLNGFEFEVEPPGDHTFELARDKDQHLACELFRYREDSNEAAFAVAAVEKIYAHESLTFNNIVVCEVISMWKAGLKDNMDARSDVYVLSNGCRKYSDDSAGYY
ncbi:hypothetical protein Tco_1579330, partial [Tanacetum coccineum]